MKIKAFGIINPKAFNKIVKSLLLRWASRYSDYRV